jgi:hypothetical protein
MRSAMNDPRSHFTINREEISAKVIDGEAVIINRSTGIYYSLSGSGALVWALIERGNDCAAIAAALVERYGIGVDQAGAELDLLLEQLLSETLIAADNGVVAPTSLDLEFPDATYAPPALEKYSDMADLLALDPPMPGIENIPWRKPGT